MGSAQDQKKRKKTKAPPLELTLVMMLPLLLSLLLSRLCLLLCPTTSSSRAPPFNANGMSKNMSNEMTVMSKLKALESSWEFSALHAELDVICLPEDNDDVLWCASCGDRCGCSWR